MDKKILIIGDIKEAKRRMFKGLWEYIEELSKYENVKLFGTGCEGFKKNMDILEVIKFLYGNDFPDLIYLDDDKYCEGFTVRGLRKIKIPKATFIEDTRIEKKYRCRLINKNKIDYVFVTINQDLPFYMKECKNARFVLRQHCVNTEIFKDYGLKKENDVLLYGCIADIYPLRTRLRNILKGQNKIKCKIIDHPGYWKKGELPKINEFYVGEKLAKEINRSWITIATKSKYNYLLAKYFEIAACNSLIAGDMPDLGRGIFKNNYLELDNDHSDEQITETIKDYLSNKNKIRGLSENSHETVLRNHSTEKEVKRFISVISKELSNK